MKLRLLIPAILVAATGFGVPANGQSETLDAQAQAAALLSGANVTKPIHAQDGSYALSSSVKRDAHASAAALLSGRVAITQSSVSTRATVSTVGLTQPDAHAHAAALLRGSPMIVEERSQSTRRDDALNEHPAVLVAQTWNARGIDPNTFIVGHPAGLQLTSESRTEREPNGTESVTNARVATLAR